MESNPLEKALFRIVGLGAAALLALNVICSLQPSAPAPTKSSATQKSSGQFAYLQMRTGMSSGSIPSDVYNLAPKCTHTFVLRELVRKPDAKRFGWDIVEGSFGYHVSDCKEAKGSFPIELGRVAWKDGGRFSDDVQARIKAVWDGGVENLNLELVNSETFQRTSIGGNDLRFRGFNVPTKAGGLNFELGYGLETWVNIPDAVKGAFGYFAEMSSYDNRKSSSGSRPAVVPAEAVDMQLYENWFRNEISGYFIEKIFPENGGVVGKEKFEVRGTSGYFRDGLRLSFKVTNKTKNEDLDTKNDGLEAVAVVDSTGRVLQAYPNKSGLFSSPLRYSMKYNRTVNAIAPGYTFEGEVNIDWSPDWYGGRYLMGNLRVGGNDIATVIDLQKSRR